MMRRMEGFPVHADVLSRFRSARSRRRAAPPQGRRNRHHRRHA
ncbi:MAG: hypothetical protein ACLUI3_04875 [Christensenellales bacterium]